MALAAGLVFRRSSGSTSLMWMAGCVIAVLTGMADLWSSVILFDIVPVTLVSVAGLAVFLLFGVRLDGHGRRDYAGAIGLVEKTMPAGATADFARRPEA